jgi:hypothetical protein
MQSPSTPHAAPAPPFPAMHDFVEIVSVPLWCAEQALE